MHNIKYINTDLYNSIVINKSIMVKYINIEAYIGVVINKSFELTLMLNRKKNITAHSMGGYN